MPVSTTVGTVKKQPRKLLMTPEAKKRRLDHKKLMKNATERAKASKADKLYYKKNKVAILKHNKTYAKKARAVGRKSV